MGIVPAGVHHPGVTGAIGHLVLLGDWQRVQVRAEVRPPQPPASLLKTLVTTLPSGPASCAIPATFNRLPTKAVEACSEPLSSGCAWR
jgi:hypothetical protein